MHLVGGLRVPWVGDSLDLIEIIAIFILQVGSF